MTRSHPPSNPPRLRDGDDAMGRLLRRALSEPPQASSNVASQFARLEQAMAGHSRKPRAFGGYALVGALAFTLLVALLGSRLDWRSPVCERSTATPETVQAPSTTTPETVGARSTATPESIQARVEVGARASHRLADGSVVSVPAEGRATITRRSPTETVVELERGAVELTVAPRALGEKFEVDAGRFRFRVVGTRFRVARDGEGLSLTVAEGRVEVIERDRVLRVVEAGGTWKESRTESRPEYGQTAPARGEAPSTPSKAPHASNAGKESDCLALARAGEHDVALGCFRRQAAGEGVSAEIGFYESARLEHEIQGDARRALETLRRHRERFPNGTLSVEVDLKIVRLLVELGRDREALAQSEVLLKNSQLKAPEAELRFLRGKLYQRRGELESAAAEFARVPVSSAAQSDRAKLEYADCVEKLGDARAARAHYERLSTSAHASVRDEARRRLATLRDKESPAHEPE